MKRINDPATCVYGGAKHKGARNVCERPRGQTCLCGLPVVEPAVLPSESPAPDSGVVIEEATEIRPAAWAYLKRKELP